VRFDHVAEAESGANDAKGSTWSAIASEAGRLNYNYPFLVYFLLDNALREYSQTQIAINQYKTLLGR
jgi:hypothetical protein